MSEKDAAQDAALEQLRDAAKENRSIDLAQWVAMALIALGIAVYVNVILVSTLNIQGEALRTVTGRCK